MKSILILLGILFIGCYDGSRLANKAHHTQNPCTYIVTEFESWGDHVRYYVEAYNVPIMYDDNFTFIDSVGKYQIGDTIYINFTKN